MTTAEIDVGAIVAALIALTTGIGVYLRASGKWTDFQTRRAERKEAAELQTAQEEASRVEKLEARVDAMVAERMAERDARIDRLEEINEQHRQRIGVLTDSLAAMTKDNTQYRSSLDALEASLVETNRKYDADRAQWNHTQQSLERDIETLRDRIASLESELARKTTELEGVRADMKTYKERMREMELANARLEERNDGLKKTNDTLASLIERALSTLPPQEPRTLGASGR